MEAILINELREKWKIADLQARKVRFALPYTYDDFIVLLSAHANIIMRERRESNLFVIDKNNENVIRLLYDYATLKSTQVPLEKGIMLVGRFGCGKSLIMESYSRIVTDYAHFKCLPDLKFIKSTSLFNELRLNPNKYQKKPVVIDEFGRENKEGKNYGEEIRPLVDWLSIRYDIGVLTHGTSNFKLETLSTDEFYGPMIGDRLKSMFNFIVLPGESRRI